MQSMDRRGGKENNATKKRINRNYERSHRQTK